MSKVIREQLNALLEWEAQHKSVNPSFTGYETEQVVVLEFIETIGKQSQLELVDELKKKVTSLTRIIFKISQDCLKLFKDRKKVLEQEQSQTLQTGDAEIKENVVATEEQ